MFVILYMMCMIWSLKHICVLVGRYCLPFSLHSPELLLWSSVATNCKVKWSKNLSEWMHLVSEESRAPHPCVCLWHHSGTYFHGYSDPGWPLKACLLQTSLRALITALYVSYPAVRRGKRGTERVSLQCGACGRKDACTGVKIQRKVEHKGMNKWKAVGRLLKGLPWETLNKTTEPHRWNGSRGADWCWEMKEGK